MWVLASQCECDVSTFRVWVLALQCERDLSCTLMKISLTDSLFASPLWVILTLLALHSSLPHPVFYAYSAAVCMHCAPYILKLYIIQSITPLVAKHFTSLTLNLSLIHRLCECHSITAHECYSITPHSPSTYFIHSLHTHCISLYTTDFAYSQPSIS